MGHQNTELGGVPIQIAISIPANNANGGLGATIRSLVDTASFRTPADTSMKISANQPGVTADVTRAAFTVASPLPGAAIATADFTANGQTISDGVEYYEPTQRTLDMYVRSTTASAVPALVILYP